MSHGPPEHQWEHFYRLKPGDVYVEAGAYYCRYGRIASKRVGSDGKVILIEPSPENAVVIEQVILEHMLNNVTLIKKAVWEKPGLMNFILGSNPSAHRVAEVSMSYLKDRGLRTVEVEVDTVDNILGELNLDHVDLFAADVENAEVAMVNGMGRWLDAKKIRNLAIAAYHKYPDGNYAKISVMLEDKGYRVIEVWGGVVYAKVQ